MVARPRPGGFPSPRVWCPRSGTRPEGGTPNRVGPWACPASGTSPCRALQTTMRIQAWWARPSVGGLSRPCPPTEGRAHRMSARRPVRMPAARTLAEKVSEQPACYRPEVAAIRRFHSAQALAAHPSRWETPTKPPMSPSRERRASHRCEGDIARCEPCLHRSADARASRRYPPLRDHSPRDRPGPLVRGDPLPARRARRGFRRRCAGASTRASLDGTWVRSEYRYCVLAGIRGADGG